MAEQFWPLPSIKGLQPALSRLSARKHESSKKVGLCQDQWVAPSESWRIISIISLMIDSLLLLRPQRQSDFGLSNLSMVSERSKNTDPREERVSLCRDNCDARVYSCRTKEETHIQNQPPSLKPHEQRSNFGPGRLSDVFRRFGNTNPLEDKFWR